MNYMQWQLCIATAAATTSAPHRATGAAYHATAVPPPVLKRKSSHQYFRDTGNYPRLCTVNEFSVRQIHRRQRAAAATTPA